MWHWGRLRSHRLEWRRPRWLARTRRVARVWHGDNLLRNEPRRQSARLRTSAEAMTWPKPSVIAAARPDQCLPGSCLSARSTAAALAATAAREVPAGVAATEVGIEAEAAAGVRAAPVRVRQLDRKGARRLRAARCCRRALLTRAARMDAASAPIGEQADDDDRGGDQDPEGQHYRMLVCEIHAALFRATQGSSAHSRSSVPGVQPSAAQTTLIREFRAGVDREVGSVRRLGSVRSRRGGSLTPPERQRTHLAGRVAARSRRAGPTDVHSRPHSGQFPRSPALRRQP